jgi:hypothetical protein
LKKTKSKLTPFVSDAEYERINTNEKKWVVDDIEPIEVDNSAAKTRKQRLQRSRSPSVSSSHTPARKRRRTITDTTSSPTISNPLPPPPPLPEPSNDFDLVNFDDFDLFSPFKKQSPVPSHSIPPLSPVLQVMTPKSTTRSRHPSSTSSTTTSTTILMPPSISHDTTTRIIRCLANTNQRPNEDKKLRIPM